MILAGIDPGLNGALAFGVELGDSGVIPFAGLTGRDLLRALRGVKCDRLILERVHAMPAKFRGSSTSWALAEHYGELKMALSILVIPYEEVLPEKWQATLGCRFQGCNYTQRKRKLKDKAQALYPYLDVTLETADALLILEYARRVYK